MDISILFYVLVGFAAQMIDGALGMAYGVSSNTFLLSLGIELAQLTIPTRATDVDDIILNTLGTLFGAAAMALIGGKA